MNPSTPDAHKSRPADVPARAVDRGGPSQKVFDWLFGYDYFIAHRSVDGKEYASALYDALTTKGNELDCFLDVKHYGAGGSLTTMQARALRKTTRLIVIVTTRAHDTDASYLRGEVAEFRQMHPQGIVVPIGTWETLTQEQYPYSQLLPHLPHLPDDICVLESAEQFGKGTPSPKTVGKLLNDFSQEWRSSTRLRWIWRTVVLLLFLLVAAVGRGVVRERETVATVSGLLNAKELVEVLKWPFCVGEAQKRVLAELEKKAGRTFGGSIWKVVEQADSLGIAGLDRAFLSAPAKRPSVEDAIKELQALRAGGTDKP